MPVERIFVASSRPQPPNLHSFIADACNLGYSVTLDGGIPGGEAWWKQAIDMVEAADAFVYALTRSSIDSPICQAELSYASDLGTPILPVLLDDGLSDADLPPILGQIQRVDYLDDSISAMIEFFKAIQSLRVPEYRETYNIARPNCPPDYSLDIAGFLAIHEYLNPMEYSEISDQFRQYVEDHYTWNELTTLVSDLRARPDFTVKARDELDKIEIELRATGNPPQPPVLSAPCDPLTAGARPIKRVFVSYSRSESDVVTHLVNDIHDLGFDVWRDQNLPGGQPWWDRIVKNIRECDAFVFAAGHASRSSKACIEELRYANELGKPIARFSVDGAPVPEPLQPSMADETPYWPRDKLSVARVATMLRSLSRTDLPTMLPSEPSVPATYLFDVRAQVRSKNPLHPREQQKLLDQIERYVQEGVSSTEIRRLLGDFMKRDDTTVVIESAAKDLLSRLELSHEQEEDALPTGVVAIVPAAPAEGFPDWSWEAKPHVPSATATAEELVPAPQERPEPSDWESYGWPDDVSRSSREHDAQPGA